MSSSRPRPLSRRQHRPRFFRAATSSTIRATRACGTLAAGAASRAVCDRIHTLAESTELLTLTLRSPSNSVLHSSVLDCTVLMVCARRAKASRSKVRSSLALRPGLCGPGPVGRVGSIRAARAGRRVFCRRFPCRASCRDQQQPKLERSRGDPNQVALVQTGHRHGACCARLAFSCNNQGISGSWA